MQLYESIYIATYLKTSDTFYQISIWQLTYKCRSCSYKVTMSLFQTKQGLLEAVSYWLTKGKHR